jgi:hypothetical protein
LGRRSACMASHSWSQSSSGLDASGVVVDIGRASDARKSVLSALAYRNLDELPELVGVNTTTEFLAKLIFDRMAAGIAAGEPGRTAMAWRPSRSPCTNPISPGRPTRPTCSRARAAGMRRREAHRLADGLGAGRGAVGLDDRRR